MTQETTTTAPLKNTSPRKRGSATRKKNDGRKGWLIKGVIGFFILSLLVSTGFFYYQYDTLKNDPNKIARDEVNTLVAELEKVIQLPQGERPTLATVTDPAKLKKEPFFSGAQSGDKVLVYTNAKKVILYRPAIKKIIEVAPLTNNVSQTDIQDGEGKLVEPVGSIKEAASDADVVDEDNEVKIENEADDVVTVGMYNGTEIIGYTYQLEDRLIQRENLEITERKKANKTDYTQTMVINIGNVEDVIVKELAEALDGEITKLPDGEDEPSTDILIIGGAE